MSIISCSLITIACQLLLTSCTNPPNPSASSTLLARSKSSSIFGFFNSQTIKNILYGTVFVLVAFFTGMIFSLIAKKYSYKFNLDISNEIDRVTKNIEALSTDGNPMAELMKILDENEKGIIFEKNKKKLKDFFEKIYFGYYANSYNTARFRELLIKRGILDSENP